MTNTKERTLSIIKPDAVADGHIGDIIARFEHSGLYLVAAKMVHLSVEDARSFYAVHAHRPFFPELVTFMTEGPVFVMTLEGEDAVKRVRDLMGATNPQQAAPGTIRADFATSIDRNAIHGSDSRENASIEIAFFFKAGELVSETVSS